MQVPSGKGKAKAIVESASSDEEEQLLGEFGMSSIVHPACNISAVGSCSRSRSCDHSPLKKSSLPTEEGVLWEGIAR